MAARLIQSSEVVRFQELNGQSPFGLPKMATQQSPDRARAAGNRRPEPNKDWSFIELASYRSKGS